MKLYYGVFEGSNKGLYIYWARSSEAYSNPIVAPDSRLGYTKYNNSFCFLKGLDLLYNQFIKCQIRIFNKRLT